MRHDIWWFSLRLRSAGLRLGALVGSGDGLAGNQFHRGLFAADAYRHLRRTGAGIGQFPEGIFHNPILQRMEGDHAQPPLRF